ncbi:hypothetical protein [Salinibacillus xinjiangensis]|uniref:DUF2524 family protein n=1 Tax=Salinibacillus xinjiangensis TaxID=1229268 RepID=A0A6G1X7K5_9BACI|nr:hypothetical protein [Salinibacillus xinjiangensis]MRG86788.1 hypothetical protein [Salinibacillus xinjiangensis]
MPIQNENEIRQLSELSQKLEEEARQAINHADPQEIQQLQTQLREVQDKIQEARGKAINGSGTSTEPLFDAQQRVEDAQHHMKRALTNLNAQNDEVQP